MSNSTETAIQPVDNAALLGYMAESAENLVNAREKCKANYRQREDLWKPFDNEHIVFGDSLTINNRFLEVAENCVVNKRKRCVWFAPNNVFEEDVEWNPARMALYEMQGNMVNAENVSTIKDLNYWTGKNNISLLSFVLMPEGKELETFNNATKLLGIGYVDTILFSLPEIPKEEDSDHLFMKLGVMRTMKKDIYLGVPLVPGNQNFNSFVSIFKNF